MLKNFFLLLALAFITACSNDQKIESPAQAQIEEYSKKLQDCEEQENKKENLQKKNIVQEKETKKVSLRKRNFKIQPDDMVLGNQGAKVILVEYFSPTCPHCVSYHKRTFPELKAKYIDTNKIAYISREFIGNKQDLDATILARCKGDLDSYLKFIDVILAKQDNWAFSKKYREILTNIGSLGSISPEEYTNCLNNENLINTLIENTQLVALEPKFAGTPSFFINGKLFMQPYTFEELSKVLEEHLREN